MVHFKNMILRIFLKNINIIKFTQYLRLLSDLLTFGGVIVLKESEVLPTDIEWVSDCDARCSLPGTKIGGENMMNLSH